MLTISDIWSIYAIVIFNRQKMTIRPLTIISFDYCVYNFLTQRQAYYITVILIPKIKNRKIFLFFLFNFCVFFHKIKKE